MKNRICQLFVLLITAFVVTIIPACKPTTETPRTTAQVQPPKETTYDRVLASGVIRAGYVVYPPGLIKDPNTQKISGIFAEVLEEAAKNLGLRVEWAEEVGWGTMIEGLKTNRYDMIGSPVWPLAQRAKFAEFTTPVYFGGLAAYVRTDDHRFDGNLAALNQAGVRIATLDGEVTDTVARYDFPKAQPVSSPQSTEIASLLKTVTSGRADVTFVEPFIALEFMRTNPNTLHEPEPGRALRLYPNTYMVLPEQGHFKAMLDSAIEELINSGFVDRVLDKYEPAKGAFYRRAAPYRTTR